MVTTGIDHPPGCLADRLLTGLGQPQRKKKNTQAGSDKSLPTLIKEKEPFRYQVP
jgi:hypothetical protein